MVMMQQMNLFGGQEPVKSGQADLHVKVRRAVALIRSMGLQNTPPVEVAYSGGKDSDVILELTKMAGIRYRAIYKNTTIDPPGTIRHAEEMGAEVLRPERSFFELVAEMGFPNHQQRFCCKFLKEFKVLDRAIMGIRKSESTRRDKQYEEPTECRYYGAKTPENHVEAIYPILDWTDRDVEQFITERGIKVHPYYYDEKGHFHVERRLGCMCCPLAYYRKRIKYFERVPGMVKAYLRAGQRFRDTHPDVETIRMYGDVYEWFVRDVFFETQVQWEEYKRVNPDADYKRLLEERFKIEL
jgi:phosphoadenosine phosphosulfate reductase